MPKESKLFDIAKKARKIGYRVQNFFKYRLLVNSKHILIVGGQNSQLKQNVINNFGDTWRIANLDYQDHKDCELNLRIPKDEFISEQKIQEISENLKQFSKHYECILYIPETEHDNKIGDISSSDIFDQYDQQQKQIIQPSLIASYLASKMLTTNGIVIYKGDEKSFSGQNQEQPSYSLAMNQINNLNLIIGERDDIDIDAFSLVLLDRNMEQDQQKYTQTELQDQIEKETKYISQCIRTWAEGSDRPLPGVFVKWIKDGDKIYPKLF